MKTKNFVFLFLIPCIILGHKINIFATVEGKKIYTQSYASDGGKIKSGTIEVYDKGGNRLLTGTTDSLGEFSFDIPKKDDLKIVVIGGMGHRAETIISAEDLPDIKIEVPEKTEPKQKKEIPEISNKKDIPVIDTLVLKRMIEDVMDEKLHTIMKMLAEQKEDKISFTEVIGGIGYIFGIIGIAAFFMRRKKNV
ncbi:MAG: hypothetical protein ACPL28_10745 [bacterium]